MSARSSSSRNSATCPISVTWVYQLSSSRTVSVTRGSLRRCSSRLRPSSMLTSTRPSSHRYHVAVDTGCPSDRSVVITAGLGLPSMAMASSGSGGFDMVVLLRTGARRRAGAPDRYPRCHPFAPALPDAPVARGDLAFRVEEEQRAARRRLRNVRGTRGRVDEGAGRVVPVAVVEDAGDHEDLLGTRFVHVDPLPAGVRVHLQHAGRRAVVPLPQWPQPDAGKELADRGVLDGGPHIGRRVLFCRHEASVAAALPPCRVSGKTSSGTFLPCIA